MTTRSFPEYTKEEMLECLMECYVALVKIYWLTQGKNQEIFDIANEPLDKMFKRISSENPAHK